MKYLGTKVGSGLGVGKCLIINEIIPEINSNKISKKEVNNEIEKVSRAIDKTIKEYEKIIDSLADGDLKELCEFNKTVLIAKSVMFKISNDISDNLTNGALAIKNYFKTKIDTLNNSNNNYLKERCHDVEDIQNNVLKKFLGINSFNLNSIKEDTILVAREITPNILLSGDLSKVKGIVSEIGGKTSHVGILSTTLGIPSIFGIPNLDSILENGELLYIDGNKGELITDLKNEDLKEIEIQIDKFNKIGKEMAEFGKKKAITKDNIIFEVNANTGDLSELDMLKNDEIDGIGLFRTEFLYLNKQTQPSEEYLFSIFKSLAEKLNSKPLIIRTLDIGGDKKCSYLNIPEEANPFLGYRAIRYCLDNTEIFKTLLRAILRASVYGKIYIMYPMISSLEDIENANKILKEAMFELESENIKFDKNIKVGAMIEVPSLAMMADKIINYVDFFSIGTNDLVQYTLAVDRVNPTVSKYYNWFNPGVIRLIKHTIDSVENYPDKFVGMCGELAADPLGVILLVGLGIDEFSVNLSAISKVKKLVSMLSYQETKEFIENKILTSISTKEIENLLDKYAKEKFGKFYI